MSFQNLFYIYNIRCYLFIETIAENKNKVTVLFQSINEDNSVTLMFIDRFCWISLNQFLNVQLTYIL